MKNLRCKLVNTFSKRYFFPFNKRNWSIKQKDIVVFLNVHDVYHTLPLTSFKILEDQELWNLLKDGNIFMPITDYFNILKDTFFPNKWLPNALQDIYTKLKNLLA